jgi:histone H3/H4
MATAHDVARAARNLITEHGTAAESIALARAKNATESNRETITWLDIAKVVRQMQRRRDR